MRLAITFSSTTILVNPANASALVEALATVKHVEEVGYGRTKHWVEKSADEQNIEIIVFDESKLEKPSSVLETLRKEKEAADNRWIEYYNKCNAAEKTLKELQDKLKAKGIVLVDEPASEKEESK